MTALLRVTVTVFSACLLLCVTPSSQQEIKLIPIRTLQNAVGQEQTCLSNDLRESAYNDYVEDVQELVTGQPCRGPGWRRVAFLNMSDPNEQCPTVLLETQYSIRTCGRYSGSSGCWSIIYNTSGTEYSRVCGRAVAYQWGQNVAFNPALQPGNRLTLEDNYLDGLSFTHGAPGSRQHIWSFAIGNYEGPSSNGPYAHCPCDSSYRNTFPPKFVGRDYFCESGATFNTRPGTPRDRLYPEDPLWDGKDCPLGDPRVGYTCCEFNNPPWFIKNLTSPTTNDIELRFCCLSHATGNDIALQLLEIYVQ